MKILFISLGCDKNTVDSEMMLGILANRGYEITDSEDDADAAVINTCCFIGDAKEESINNILQMVDLKEKGRLKAVVVTGCLGQRYTDDIHKEIPQVDAILGISGWDEIADCLDTLLKRNEKASDVIKDIQLPALSGYDRLLTTGGHFAYLKIAEGCNKRCTYCVIPYVRGNYRSVPMETLMDEAKRLADRGVKELILVAQETTLYGVDIYGKKTLPDLLTNLSNIEGIKWIRLLYCYPEEITDDLIKEIASNKKICKYIDMPIQHASDGILKRMGRLTTGADLRNVIKRLRDNIPDICIRTTLITGFPGETKKDFDELVSFVKDIRFDRLGVFTYSKEEGTGAALMKKQVPNFIKKSRKNTVMRIQQAIAFENAEAEIGRELTVMVEGKLPDESEDGKNVYACRTYKDAPDVDGFLFLNTSRELVTGDICTARVTGANNYDLVGVMNDEFTE